MYIERRTFVAFYDNLVRFELSKQIKVVVLNYLQSAPRLDVHCWTIPPTFNTMGELEYSSRLAGGLVNAVEHSGECCYKWGRVLW